MSQPRHAREWLRQRAVGAAAVEEIERSELQELDPITALALSEALLSAISLDSMPSERAHSSGFVEQQRVFLRARQ